MELNAIEVSVLMNRLARASQHLARANQELREVETRLEHLARDAGSPPALEYGDG